MITRYRIWLMTNTYLCALKHFSHPYTKLLQRNTEYFLNYSMDDLSFCLL